jgi:hypothetical protein
MPKVKGKSYPYTAKGKAAAKKARGYKKGGAVKRGKKRGKKR